jgi:hypothetical protein
MSAVIPKTPHRRAPAGSTIIDALRYPQLLGGLSAFRNLTSWSRWLVFLKCAYGLQLDPDERTIYEHHTQRSTYAPPAGGYPEAVIIVGRQSGKTQVASVFLSHEAIHTPPGPDDLYCLGVAQDHRSSLRALLRYARQPFEQVPMLAQMVSNVTTDAMTLSNNAVLAAYPCRPAAVRGLRARVAVADELAFFRSSEGYAMDLEMLRALRPCLSTTRGKLIILSSPYGQAGALWQLHSKHFGVERSTTLIWKGSAPEMNPTLPADYLQRMAEDDPEAYRSEVLGEFRAGLSQLFAPEALDACVERGVRERAKGAAPRYVAFCDAASGSGKDAFALAIAHADGDLVVLDVVRSWKPPFNPSGVIAEAATLVRDYRCVEVSGDRYAAGFVLESFRAHGLTYVPSERDRSALYLELVPLVNAGRARVLDLPDLRHELRGLERRRGAYGRDRVDHAPGGHDDLANACAGAIVLASVGGERLRLLGGNMTAQDLQRIEDESRAHAAKASREQIESAVRGCGGWFPGDLGPPSTIH